MPLAYVAGGRSLSNIPESLRLSVSFVFPMVAWVGWAIVALLLWPFRPIYNRFPWTLKAFWFLVWVAHVAVFVALGPLNPEERARATEL